ncbi:hypothetical protein BO71DRAFT_228256 [Aspergillus ellipticus CBS 707.79]|uniref:Uncharacterized protein n=1 Tax=Aspergillus ellipticus CBS 707.79 TaxID=1448320 RepID=A0A319DAV7_9EURO|nr:hypothetical protein BO71DRAFT_228256 [Aspergillus ellipticus CBS 707.79]
MAWHTTHMPVPVPRHRGTAMLAQPSSLLAFLLMHPALRSSSSSTTLRNASPALPPPHPSCRSTAKVVSPGGIGSLAAIHKAGLAASSSQPPRPPNQVYGLPVVPSKNREGPVGIGATYHSFPRRARILYPMPAPRYHPILGTCGSPLVGRRYSGCASKLGKNIGGLV